MRVRFLPRALRKVNDQGERARGHFHRESEIFLSGLIDISLLSCLSLGRIRTILVNFERRSDMTDLSLKAILAGVLFGIWPLLMNRSGLNGNVSSACFGIVTLIGVLPFAIYTNGFSIPTAKWTMIVLAGLCGALGLLAFNGMLAKASLDNVGTLFVLMTVVQIIVAASYQAYMKGFLSVDKFFGYVAAVVAAYLLFR